MLNQQPDDHTLQGVVNYVFEQNNLITGSPWKIVNDQYNFADQDVQAYINITFFSQLKYMKAKKFYLLPKGILLYELYKTNLKNHVIILIEAL